MDRIDSLNHPAAGWRRWLGRARRWLGAVRPPAKPPHADELAGMGPRELADLGIGRSEIPHVLAQPCGASRVRTP